VIYFDTAYLAKCYVSEVGSEAVRALAAEHDRIACCELGSVELASVFHRKLREGEIDRAVFEVLFRQFQQDNADGLWKWLPFNSDLLQQVTTVLRTLPADCFLRSADAIHLTCASRNGFSDIYSSDRHLLAAAKHFDIAGRNILTSASQEKSKKRFQEPKN